MKRHVDLGKLAKDALVTKCVLVGVEEVVQFNETDCHDRRQTFGMIEVVDFERCAVVYAGVSGFRLKADRRKRRRATAGN